MAGPLDTRQTSGAEVAGMILLWLVRAFARGVVRRFRWPAAIGRRTPLGCAAGQARGGSCFARLPRPLLLRKAGLKGSGCARRQLLRSAAQAPVAPQGGPLKLAATAEFLLAVEVEAGWIIMIKTCET
ncbi:hypothetical protein [Paenibacillus sp.]